MCKWTETNGGQITYREEGARGREGHEAQKPLTGKSFLFWRDSRSKPFRCASFYPFSQASRLPTSTPHQRPSHYWGYDSSLATGPMYFVLAPLNQKKIDKSGRNRRER